MDFPKDLRYTKDHEWARPESGEVVSVGITEHAQSALGEIVFVELPAIGRKLSQHDKFGVVESIKAASDLYSPVTGEVVEINSALPNQPSNINQSPYKDGWMIKVRVTEKGSLDRLLNSEQYKNHVEGKA